MKRLTFTGGNWTEAGNYSAYDQEIGRVHLFGKQMEGIGYKKGDTVKFPMFGIGVEKKLNKIDSEGNPTEETFTRWQANSIFKTTEEFVQVLASSKLVDIEVNKVVKAAGTSAGLTDKELEALVLSLG